MSRISSAPTRVVAARGRDPTTGSRPRSPQEIGGQSWAKDLVKNLGTTLNRWCVAYLTWRIERTAITQLWSMSDRQLRDIGISRSEIVSAVKGEVDRVRAFSRSS